MTPFELIRARLSLRRDLVALPSSERLSALIVVILTRVYLLQLLQGGMTSFQNMVLSGDLTFFQNLQLRIQATYLVSKACTACSVGQEFLNLGIICFRSNCSGVRANFSRVTGCLVAQSYRDAKFFAPGLHAAIEIAPAIRDSMRQEEQTDF